MEYGNQGWNQARPIDVAELWRKGRQDGRLPEYPGFSCQFLKEDDEDEKPPDGESPENALPSAKPEQPMLFRASI